MTNSAPEKLPLILKEQGAEAIILKSIKYGSFSGPLSDFQASILESAINEREKEDLYSSRSYYLSVLKSKEKLEDLYSKIYLDFFNSYLFNLSNNSLGYQRQINTDLKTFIINSFSNLLNSQQANLFECYQFEIFYSPESKIIETDSSLESIGINIFLQNLKNLIMELKNNQNSSEDPLDDFLLAFRQKIAELVNILGKYPKVQEKIKKNYLPKEQP